MYMSINMHTHTIKTTPSEDLEVLIIAEDTGFPILSSTSLFTLFLEDINDFPPVFSELEYSTTTLSTAPMGTSIIKVTAIDRDGEDNLVTYQFVPDNTTGIRFSIDENGIIRNQELFPAVEVSKVTVGWPMCEG